MHSIRIAGAALALMVCTASPADPLAPTLKIGDPAPPLRPMTWLKGEPVQGFEPGRVYVVEFWSVECVPCRELMPELSALQKKHADRLTVIGVNVRNGNLVQVPAKVEKFVRDQGAKMDYTVAMDDPQKNTLYESWVTAAGAYGIPTAIIVDGKGRMVWVGHPHGKEHEVFNTAVDQALAGESDLAAAGSVDEQFEALVTEGYPKPPSDITKPADRMMWRDRAMKEFNDRAFGFLSAHPDYPERWQLIGLLVARTPEFITGFKPEFDAHPGMDNVIRDEAAIRAHHAKLRPWAEALVGKSNALSADGDVAELTLILNDIEDLGADPSIPERIAAYAGHHPDSFNVILTVGAYIEALQRTDPNADLKQFWKVLADSPNPEVRAKARLAFEPMTLPPFKAIDGRRVDLASLRGKVVLIDYWSTSCGPCVKEMPDLKALYAKYHGRGFEIIGIAMEGDDKTDSKEKLVKFVRNQGLPWPQYCDMKGHMSEPALQYYVQTMPTNFLLDKSGRMVAYGDLGHILTVPEIERQLKILLKESS